MAGTRSAAVEPPRSTAYYYADLERLKRKNGSRGEAPDEPHQNPDDRSDCVETGEVANEGPVAEVPPLRDRRPPERKLEETYSTAGTFPMPEPKEKEPLLAELEVVGRLPLTQLDSTSTGVRRSRSWYLCCPNIGEDEISRESSWRYSSLRPVTAPPLAGQNGLLLVASQSSGGAGAGAGAGGGGVAREEAAVVAVVAEVAALRGERDALAAALAAERRRAAEEARAHDARLAELHGVIAELVRRRAQDKCSRAIPEEELSDECESTTQPAGELDNDADRSRTDQNDTSSLSACDVPSPPRHDHQHQQENLNQRDDTSDSSAREPHHGLDNLHVEVSTPQQTDPCDTSVNYSERDSEICVSTARCCQYARGAHLLPDGCELPEGLLPPSPGRCESRQAKLAARVRLRRANDTDSSNQHSADEGRCQGDALLPCEDAVALHQEGALSAAWRARCLRLQADCRVLDCALARALDTAHRLTCACAAQESSSVALCSALRAADRALETYDVLLALAETQPRAPSHQQTHERRAAEAVARRLLRRLEAAPALGEPLLSPGPWLQPHHHEISDKECDAGAGGEGGDSGGEDGAGAWGAEEEASLRRHAARLKTETVALRTLRPPPHLFSYHDAEEEEDGVGKSLGGASMADMEAAVMMQEVLAVREARAAQRAAALRPHAAPANGTAESSRSRRRRERERHWLDSRASETDL